MGFLDPANELVWGGGNGRFRDKVVCSHSQTLNLNVLRIDSAFGQFALKMR